MFPMTFNSISEFWHIQFHISGPLMVA